MPQIEGASAALAPSSPIFGPLVQVCAQHGIGRTRAFELARAGLLETFYIGTKRYVYLESLARLPMRLSGMSRPMAMGLNPAPPGGE